MKEFPGDGSALRPVKRWHFIWRTVMGIEHAGHQWDIDVDFFDWDERVYLYQDGLQARVQRGTSTFDLPDSASIEVAWSTYGLRRAHLVKADGSQHQLTPIQGTAEHWRAELAQNHPRLSRWMDISSWIILAIVFALEIPQALAAIAEFTQWYQFMSFVTLPAWLNSLITVAGVVAGLERALRLRYHWLLD